MFPAATCNFWRGVAVPIPTFPVLIKVATGIGLKEPVILSTEEGDPPGISKSVPIRFPPDSPMVKIFVPVTAATETSVFPALRVL